MWSALVPKSGDGAPSHLACCNSCQRSRGDSQDQVHAVPSKPASTSHPHLPSKKQRIPRPAGTESSILPSGVGLTCGTSASSRPCLHGQSIHLLSLVSHRPPGPQAQKSHCPVSASTPSRALFMPRAPRKALSEGSILSPAESRASSSPWSLCPAGHAAAQAPCRSPGRLRVPQPGTPPECAAGWPSPEGTRRRSVEPRRLWQSGTAAPSSAFSPHDAEWRVGGFSLHCKSLLIRVLQCCLEGKQPPWRESKGVQNSTCTFSCPRQVLELAPGEPGSVDKAKASLADCLAGSRSHPFPFSCTCFWHRKPWLSSLFKPGKQEERRRRQREEGFQVCGGWLAAEGEL